MTPLRQAFCAALVLLSSTLSVAASAEPAPIGPPTAADAAAAAAAAAAVAPTPAPAAAPAPNASAPHPATWLAQRPAAKPVATGSSAIPSTGRVLGLLLVVGSLGGAALYLKRRGRGDGKRPALPQRLLVVSSTRIGPKAHAVIVAVAGRQMLLGVTDSSVKRLAFIDEIEDDEREAERERESPYGREPLRRRAAPPATTRAAAIAVHNVTPAPAKAGSFADMLKTAFGKRAPAPEVDAASTLAAETQDSAFGKPVAGNPSNVRMLDVEGQAQGLLRRLSDPRA